MPRPTPAEIDAAIETLGNLVAMNGGEGDEALDVVKDATTLPQLMGTTEAAKTLGTTTSSLPKWTTLPEPLYSRDHPNRRRRIRAGSLWDADAIRALARKRRAA